MQLKLLPLVFLLALLQPSRVLAALVARPIVASPKPGQALQGVVTITGSTNISNFQSAEISFRYDNQDNSSWFPLQQSSQPVDNGALATWDTTTIADDVYRIRLVVTLQNGSILTTEVPGLRVRNYTAIETATPSPTRLAAQSLPPVAAGTQTVLSTPTDLPANPAQVSPLDLAASAVQGGLFTAIIFMCIGGYLLVRSITRHR